MDYDPFEYPCDSESDDWTDEEEQISIEKVATTSSSTSKSPNSIGYRKLFT